MKTEPQDHSLPLQFERIRGFLDLRMPQEAWRELDQVPLNARTDRSYRWLRITACIALDKHFEASKMVAELCREHPEDEENWLFLANLLGNMSFFELAAEVLTDALEHTDEPDIRYELAAYLCLSGKVDEARERLEALFAVHPLHRDKAEDDARFEAIADMFFENEE
jgi:thioredoxin-like negative regulator of GroEL